MSKAFTRVILHRMFALDPLLRRKQAGFRKGKSCSNEIFTLADPGTVSQMKHTVYKNFLDFEKAFDSVHPESPMGHIEILWNSN